MSPESAASKASLPPNDSPAGDVMRVARTNDDVDNSKPHSKPILKPHGRRHLVATSDHKLPPPLRAAGKRVSFVEPDNSPSAATQPDSSPLESVQHQRKYYSKPKLKWHKFVETAAAASTAEAEAARTDASSDSAAVGTPPASVRDFEKARRALASFLWC